MLQSILLFLFQFAAHCGLIYFLFHFSLTGLFLVTLFYFLFAAIGSSAFFHRLLSHKSYVAPSWFFIFGMICGTLGGIGSGLTWVSIHRLHHLYTDQPNDPHSPKHRGFFYVQFLSMFAQPKLKNVTDIARNKIVIFFHIYYWPIHIFYLSILFVFFQEYIVEMYLAPAALNWLFSGLVNNIAHTFGYVVRNSNNMRKNNIYIGILSMGEGWHNHHHNEPNDYRFGHRKWEFDPAARCIELFCK